MFKDQKDTTAFLLKEYETARRLIDNDIKEINQNEIYILTFIGAFYLFLFQMKLQEIYAVRAFFCFPIVVAIYGLVRYNAHRYTIKTHEAYIKEKIESYFLQCGRDPCGLAWFYDDRSPKLLKKVRFSYHYLLLAVTVFIAVISFYDGAYVLSIMKSAQK